MQLVNSFSAILKNLPNKSGVYTYFDKNGVIIYVGKAKNLKKRVNSYFIKSDKNLKTQLLVNKIVYFDYISGVRQ